ncbi:hypothetical protein KUF54_14665 [Comamonas sp. Y33R10-2]|uniref:hypothetical protein n=1 Tax=Comamonas sp. Y33R10-2 TaxID=2853257 RepID=UPI001C5C97F5|nr:hypothetical protein [Comamonas sp. Y33R10-2]QXZ09253.1 hypothetical protein KUF54_14665 [Comamonas sp. Y33R10-2]
MTTVCLSIFEHAEPQVLANHQHYCSRMGYVHVQASMQGLQSRAHKLVFKYEMLLHQLRKMADDALLICATDDCVFLNMLPAEPMLQGRDRLLLGIDGENSDRQTAIQVWRNTEEVRHFVLDCIARSKIMRGVEQELDLHLDQDYVSAYTQVAGNYATVKCGVRYAVNWLGHSNVWTLSLYEVEIYAGVHPLFRQSLFEHINDWQQKAMPLFEFSAYAHVPQGGHGVHLGSKDIALVMYYTPNIRSFSAIAESNIERYCKRHGYTLYVHRETPPDVEEGISGTWLKPWLLHKHLPQHEWVIWVDADMLLIDQSQPLEPLLQGRDILAAHDIGDWLINAGMLGFRRTQKNTALLAEMLDGIRAVKDKSSTYASGGDQTVIANLLQRELGWTLADGLDLISLNTPWFFQQGSSQLVHYYGMVNELRATIMAAQDRKSYR